MAQAAGRRRAHAFFPALFVVLWSTGFIAAKYGLPYAPPYKFLLDGIADERAGGSEAALLGSVANRFHCFLG